MYFLKKITSVLKFFRVRCRNASVCSMVQLSVLVSSYVGRERKGLKRNKTIGRLKTSTQKNNIKLNTFYNFQEIHVNVYS